MYYITRPTSLFSKIGSRVVKKEYLIYYYTNFDVKNFRETGKNK